MRPANTMSLSVTAPVLITSLGLIASTGSAAEPPATSDIQLAAATDIKSPRLNLRAPDITTVFTREEIDRVLRLTRDPDTIEEVEVERERAKRLPSTTPDIPPGIFAPFWALANPTQAWRILLPLPPDQAGKIGSPDATDSYREPTLPPQ